MIARTVEASIEGKMLLQEHPLAAIDHLRCACSMLQSLALVMAGLLFPLDLAQMYVYMQDRYLHNMYIYTPLSHVRTVEGKPPSSLKLA